VGRLNSKIGTAMANGQLQHFNREYRRRRIEAASRGQQFPTYGRALAKLRAALAGTIAGTNSPTEMLHAVFDEN
jgi:hypothetical protein